MTLLLKSKSFVLYQHFGVKFGSCFHGDWSEKLILQYSGFKLIQTIDSVYLDLNSKMATIIAEMARQNFHRERVFRDRTNPLDC